MDIEKTIGSYAKIYRKALVEGKIKNIDDEIRLYQKRLREMYNSDAFQKHSRYQQQWLIVFRFMSLGEITTDFTSGEMKGKFSVNENCSRGQIITFFYSTRTE